MAKRNNIDREMLDADFIICVPADHVIEFLDNVFAVCCHCGRSVQHRPSVPRQVRKLCPECGQAATKQDHELKITAGQRREITAALKRQRH